jgi:hypothetical protein
MSALAEDHDGNWQLIFYNEIDFKRSFELPTQPAEKIPELKMVAFERVSKDFKLPNFF